MKTLEEHRKNIQDFADKWNVEYTEEGEIGFGRECVGLLKDDNYIAYNPTDDSTYENISEFYNEVLYDITPENAYHKGCYLAVLGRNEDRIIQLSEWIDKLKELDVSIVKYKTGAVGIQALISGEYAYTVKPSDTK